jgi:hypothetical protein
MLVKIYRKIDEFLHYLYSCRYCLRSYKHYKGMYSAKGIIIRNLTKKEKLMIKDRWNIKWTMFGLGYLTHKLYKSVIGEFLVDICPEVVFRTRIEPSLIKKNLREAWDDKNYFERLLPGYPFPEAIVRNIYGSFYDEKYNPIKREEAIESIGSNLPVIIKPTVESGVSRGIEQIEHFDDIEKIMKAKGENYIVQKKLKPCAEFKLLTENAVPIIRIISVLIDGEPYILSSSLRTNTIKDAIADNAITENGGGMVVIGIDENGCLKKNGYYSGGEVTTQLPNGFVFDKMQIPKFDELKKLVLEAQKQMPMFKIIGFDVTLDEQYEPIVMEYNLKGIGVYYYQLANGALFGKYTDRIIDKYVKK